MSTSNQQDTHDPNSLLYYAPRRLRDRANALRALQPWQGVAGQPAPTAAPEQMPGLPPEKPFPESLRPSNEPDPIESVAITQQRARRKEILAIAMRFGAVAAVITGIAVPSVIYFAAERQAPAKDGSSPLASTPPAKDVAMAKLIKKMSAPALAVEDAEGNVNGALPLGVTIIGQPQSDTVNLSGLAADAKLTTGTEAGAGQWRVAVKDLTDTAVIPPRDYVGQMKIVAELPTGDSQSVARKSVHLTWKQAAARPENAPPPPPTTSGSASAKAKPSEPARQLNPAEIAALTKRGEELLSSGDIPAARLLLQRAAEARDARAAFQLATTYDPNVTHQLAGNTDPALARTWYQRARDWGSPVAPKQLEALASVDR